MAEQVTFTPADAQRIANTVTAHEKAQKTPIIQDYSEGNWENSILVFVQIIDQIQDGFWHGNILNFNPETNSYTTGDSIYVKEVNNRSMIISAKYVGKLHGTKIINNNLKAVAVVNTSYGGGDASLSVVTDVICTPNGLEVTTATLAGANYDTAVIRQFLGLSDVIPKSFLANQGRVVKVNDAATGLEFGPIVDANYTTFIALTDTPNTYGTGNEYKVCHVNSTSNAITFGISSVTTTGSIQGGGNTLNSFTSIALINDNNSPGNNKFYGTSESGTKGWRVIQLTTLNDWPEMAGKEGYFVKVNATGTGVIFENINLTQLIADISDLQARVTALESQ